VFDKILIANRGEIAVRIMRTCRELGITTVAVYSDLDRDSLHTRYADEAYALGGQTATESYLDTAAILDVLARSGAEAVHPGYGFYAENADFARAVADRGATWIGPPPEAIEVMGDKISARNAAAAGGVESVPGTLEPIGDVDDIVAFGDEFGYPLAIKAAYGGGGKGMKVVHDMAGAAKAFESATREAKAYFGRSEAYLERYLTRPRHIEIQVLADTNANAIWLGERDCSVQRRHQKLVEETPAPGIDDGIRTAMGEAAVQVAKACGYVNAGTVEMLYEDGEFYFLEMNTRLQVEHPVTEMVTGLDLVAEQLRIAAGGPLSVTQGDVRALGHSIEVRINAENPSKGFLPAPGTITKLAAPSGPGVRWDGGYESGDAVSQFYDNLVGKLVVWAPDRDRARHRMTRALREFVIEGIKTTLPAHEAIIEHPDFAAGKHSTRWLEEEVDQALLADSPTAEEHPPAAGEVGVDQTVAVEVNGKRFTVTMWMPEAAATAGPLTSGVRPRLSAAARSTTGGVGGSITAPMQGTIVKLLVAEGDTVEPGQGVLVLEAMKMENHINAEEGGTVTEIRVAPGDAVGTGDVLVIVE
jgi:acetyl-CoA/propionyl-CoA carboxylase, biotin carboxylase, biotin carboxyl carrier protein